MGTYGCPIRASGIYVRIRRYDYCWCKGCEAAAKAAALFAWPREKYEVLHRLVDPKQRKGLRVAWMSTAHIVAMMLRGQTPKNIGRARVDFNGNYLQRSFNVDISPDCTGEFCYTAINDSVLQAAIGTQAGPGKSRIICATTLKQSS